ncbi:MAG: hypothetical protein H7X93_01990 [Sphingomonadaceae bacterium]|nr:hypothetical protein [Sphingomonadaceae bacterium]
MLDQDTPRTRRVRHDGWTPERQKEFIERLAELGPIAMACGLAAAGRIPMLHA